MEVFLLRHAIPIETTAWSDSDRTRPLTSAGLTELRRVLNSLKSHRGLESELILASPYARTLHTARVASEILEAPFETLQALESGASPERILQACYGRDLPGKLLLVGHSPDLGLLAGHLTGEPFGNYAFARSGCAKLTGELIAGGMNLHWLLTPSEAALPPG